jgi:hypothetical protein
MTTAPVTPAAPHQAAVDAALLVLKSMGLSLNDLATAPGQRPEVPTFAEYVRVVPAQVTEGTLRAYGSYWNRVVDKWGSRHLDEPTPSDVRQFAREIKENALSRRNGRGGRSAVENFVGALGACTTRPRTTA